MQLKMSEILFWRHSVSLYRVAIRTKYTLWGYMHTADDTVYYLYIASSSIAEIKRDLFCENRQ